MDSTGVIGGPTICHLDPTGVKPNNAQLDSTGGNPNNAQLDSTGVNPNSHGVRVPLAAYRGAVAVARAEEADKVVGALHLGEAYKAVGEEQSSDEDDD